MIRIVFVLLAFLGAFGLTPAWADTFTEPGRVALYNTLIRFGAINIHHDDIIDEYLMATECDLHKNFFKDDFKWQKIRAAVRQKVKQEVEVFPIGYYFDTELQLGRYDFKESLYRFSDKTKVRNVNAITIYNTHEVVCGVYKSNILPTSYRIVLDHPIYIDGLPLGEADAKALMKRMDEAKNMDRLVYTRFNMRVTYISPLNKEGEDKAYKQRLMNSVESALRMDGRLDSVDFFEDADRTKLIYTYREGTF